jgi:hypothetical protein
MRKRVLALETNGYRHAEISWQGSRMLAFSSGFGDGGYPLYVGTSESGAVVAALIDFQILPWD